jgi:hypothetical protein
MALSSYCNVNIMTCVAIETLDRVHHGIIKWYDLIVNWHNAL